jgi:ribose-phosphate pyrophosphokinase
MILFAPSRYVPMETALTRLPLIRGGQFTVGRYDNGELHATVRTPVSGQHCVVLASIAPPDEELLSALLLAHTLKKEGAIAVTALLPYLAYSRQDKDKPGQSMATAWAGSLLRASGFDRVVTVDAHSERDVRLFPIPLTSLSPAAVFADALRTYQLTEATIVAPDDGAIDRCAAVKKATGIAGTETPYFEKQRSETGITHMGPIGFVGPRVVIIDDILDTGTTLVSACEKLLGAGARETYIMVTHGLFTGTHWKRLWTLGVRRIFCTDTLPVADDLDRKNIVTLSVIPLLQRQLLALEAGAPADAKPSQMRAARD